MFSSDDGLTVTQEWRNSSDHVNYKTVHIHSLRIWFDTICLHRFHRVRTKVTYLEYPRHNKSCHKFQHYVYVNSTSPFTHKNTDSQFPHTYVRVFLSAALDTIIRPLSLWRFLRVLSWRLTWSRPRCYHGSVIRWQGQAGVTRHHDRYRDLTGITSKRFGSLFTRTKKAKKEHSEQKLNPEHPEQD